MTSIFYPLLISMLPPPPPLPLPPHPPLPPSLPPGSVISIPLLIPPSTHFVHPPAASVHPAPWPSVLRENVHVHRAHSRRNNHFFVPDNTRSPRRPRVLQISPRLPTAASGHLAQSPARHHSPRALLFFCRTFFSSLFFYTPTYLPIPRPPTPLCHLLSNRAKSN